MNRWPPCAALALVLVGSGAHGAEPRDICGRASADYARHAGWKQGRAHLEAGRYADALDHYEKAFPAVEKRASALALAWFLDDYAVVLEALGRSLDAAPLKARGYRVRARLPGSAGQCRRDRE